MAKRWIDQWFYTLTTMKNFSGKNDVKQVFAAIAFQQCNKKNTFFYLKYLITSSKIVVIKFLLEINYKVK